MARPAVISLIPGMMRRARDTRQAERQNLNLHSASLARHATLWCHAHVAQSAELITSSQAGAILGKSARTVQRLTEKGLLRGVVKVPGPNGAVLYDRAEVEKYAASLAEPA